MIIFSRRLILFLLVLFLSARAQGQSPVWYFITSHSKVWIEGGATIGSYQCMNLTIHGVGKLMEPLALVRDTNAADASASSSVHVTVAVVDFKCGNPRMDQDLQDAMKVKEYPDIVYDLLSSKIIGVPDTAGGWFSIGTVGNLTIAGATKRIEMMVKARSATGGGFYIVGAKEILMSDFNVTRPSAFFGLIKADDLLTVHFDIMAKEDQSMQRRAGM